MKDLPKVGIIPIGPRFIAKMAEVEEVTEGGIHLPTKAQEKEKRIQPEAIVIRIAEALQKEPNCPLKPGMRVLLNAGAPLQAFRYGGEEYIMVDWPVVKGIYE